LNLAHTLKKLNDDPRLNEESDEFQDVIRQIDNIGQDYGHNLLTANVINAASDLFVLTQQKGFSQSNPEFKQAAEIMSKLFSEQGPVISLEDPQYLEAASIYMGLK
jgi:hypothetical protein